MKEEGDGAEDEREEGVGGFAAGEREEGCEVGLLWGDGGGL